MHNGGAMKNIIRLFSWIVFILLIVIYARVLRVGIDILLLPLDQGDFKTILWDTLAISILLITFWSNLIICENHPGASLFWSFMFNSRRVLKFEDIRDGEELVVFGVERKFLTVDGEDGIEKLLGVEKYFSDIEFGDVLGRSGNFFYHTGVAKERISVPI